MKRNLKQHGKETLVVCLLGAACVVALIGLIAVARTSAQKQTTIVGEFTPPPFESAAAFGVPEVDESLGWSELSVREGYVAHVCGVLRADADGSVAVWFSSDADNEVWLRLRLKNADGETLGETGVLKPGEYVETMQLNNKAKSGDVILQILGYETEINAKKESDARCLPVGGGVCRGTPCADRRGLHFRQETDSGSGGVYPAAL